MWSGSGDSPRVVMYGNGDWDVIRDPCTPLVSPTQRRDRIIWTRQLHKDEALGIWSVRFGCARIASR